MQIENSLMSLIFLLGNNIAADTSIIYGYAQLPNNNGEFTYIYSERGANFLADSGSLNEDQSTAQYYCQSLTNLVFTAPKIDMKIGDSWTCFNQKYTYKADSLLFFVEGRGPTDVKIIFGESNRIIYYSPEIGVMAAKNNANNMVWYLSTNHGLFGAAWCEENSDLCGEATLPTESKK
ncbi:hypothetical protein [Pseudidiomarina mangrovi]|uniref:hypothetical protein n=1 Tax=Pseudidiomarina mangrovi TaxID=2487133 RepID=UPI000FCB9BB0|nr:hypothetical protein [Pseudidiomarina mangrovi]